MRCLTCKNGSMKPSSTAYFVLEKIDDMLDRLEQIASKIFIMDYATSAA